MVGPPGFNPFRGVGLKRRGLLPFFWQLPNEEESRTRIRRASGRRTAQATTTRRSGGNPYDCQNVNPEAQFALGDAYPSGAHRLPLPGHRRGGDRWDLAPYGFMYGPLFFEAHQ